MKYFEYFCNLNSLFKKSDEKKHFIFCRNCILDAVFFVGTDEMEFCLSDIY